MKKNMNAWKSKRNQDPICNPYHHANPNTNLEFYDKDLL